MSNKENKEEAAAEQENGPLIEDEIERSKVGIMRALCDRQDPATKEVDDLMIRRFLRARDLDIEKASTLFLKYLTWKRSILPKGHIAESEIANDLSHKKVCMQGHDKMGRPIVVAIGNRHNPSKGNPEEFKRFVVYTLEKICARMPRGQEKFITIADLQGWGYSNCDIRGYLAALSTLQFNAGPRICLGKDLAYLQMKTIAAAVLLRHRITVVPGHKVEQKMSLTLFMKNGLLVNLHKRDLQGNIKTLVVKKSNGVVNGKCNGVIGEGVAVYLNAGVAVV